MSELELSPPDGEIRLASGDAARLWPGLLAAVGRQVVVRSGAVLVLLALWQVAAMRAASMYFPPPLAIVESGLAIWFGGPPAHLFLGNYVLDDAGPSVGRMLAGWALASAAGIILGTAVGRSRLFSNLVMPWTEFARSLPSPALVPIFLLLLGTDTRMRVALIAFGSVWPVFLNTIDGMRTVEPEYLAAARIFRIPLHARLGRIILPAAMPKIFAGMRIALSIALILMVVSELVASTNGIGHQIVEAQTLFRLRDMWAGIVLLAVIGLLLNGALSLIEHRVLRWHRGARRLGESARQYRQPT